MRRAPQITGAFFLSSGVALTRAECGTSSRLKLRRRKLNRSTMHWAQLHSVRDRLHTWFESHAFNSDSRKDCSATPADGTLRGARYALLQERGRFSEARSSWYMRQMVALPGQTPAEEYGARTPKPPRTCDLLSQR